MSNPTDPPSEPWVRLHNLRLSHDDNDSAEGNNEAENVEAFTDSPQNMQPAGSMLLNRVRRAHTFDDELVAMSARREDQPSSSGEKLVFLSFFSFFMLKNFVIKFFRRSNTNINYNL